MGDTVVDAEVPDEADDDIDARCSLRVGTGGATCEASVASMAETRRAPDGDGAVVAAATAAAAFDGTNTDRLAS